MSGRRDIHAWLAQGSPLAPAITPPILRPRDALRIKQQAADVLGGRPAFVRGAMVSQMAAANGRFEVEIRSTDGDRTRQCFPPRPWPGVTWMPAGHRDLVWRLFRRGR